MFKEPVQNTVFHDAEIDSFYQGKIYGDSYLGDDSCLSTLRALLYPRMTPDDTLSLYFFERGALSQGYLSESDHYRSIASNILDLGFLTYSNTLHIVNIYGSQSLVDKNIEILADKFHDIISYNYDINNQEWEQLKKVTDLFRKQFSVLCFINKEKRSVLVFVNNLNLTKLHYLQCAILGMFPWYFSPEQGVSDDEMSLINTLRNHDIHDYLDALKKIAEKTDYRTDFIKGKLGDFENRLLKLKQVECSRCIESNKNKIENYFASIKSLYKENTDYEIYILGLESKISENDKPEIMEYFLSNKNLDLVSADDSSITFNVRGYISFFDEDIVEKVINNTSSFAYSHCSSKYTKDVVEKFMTEIFIEQNYKISTCGQYKIYLQGDVAGVTDILWSDKYEHCLPNPHINEYGCLGDNRSVIVEALTQHNYILAIEQCSASIRNLNFADHTVMNVFMSRIFGSYIDKPILESSTCGNVLTPRELLDMISKEVESDE